MSAPHPPWAESIRRKYVSGEASVFILHGNVFDEIPHDGGWITVTEYIETVLLKDNKKIVLRLDIAGGLRRVTGKLTAIEGDDPIDAAEKFLLTHDSTALVIPYAGSLVPPGDEHFLSGPDRQNTVRIHQWSLHPKIRSADNVVLLLCESLAEINARLVSNPRIAVVEVPLPDRADRASAIRACDAKLPPAHVERLADHTSGLRRVHIRQILVPTAKAPDDSERAAYIRGLLGDATDAGARAEKLAALTRGMDLDEIRVIVNPDHAVAVADDSGYAEILEMVSRRKREIIEKECAGLIEFVSASHDLDAVGGNHNIKAELAHIAQAVRSGDRKRCPMGLLLVGPMGTGKTFIAKAFAKSSGLSAVMLKNFRSKWVGSTEANLDKVLTMVKALGPIILMIDEGDRSFGGRSEDSDGGTSSRVIARLKEFMSDTDNRGVVLFMLMTNRPDKLDVDIKRAGRLDIKIPMFYESTVEGVGEIVAALCKRYGVAPLTDTSLLQAMLGHSNADLEAVVLLALRSAGDEASGVTAEHWSAAVRDFVPPRDATMLQYMELQAVFEASRRSMLPPKYANMSNDDLQAQLRDLRMSAPSLFN
jgi:transitional endoplasmic reticulum ATPase